MLAELKYLKVVLHILHRAKLKYLIKQTQIFAVSTILNIHSCLYCSSLHAERIEVY